MAERPRKPGFRVEKHPQEREKEPKTKILILEDQFAEQAQQGLDLPCFEVRIVKSIEELKNLNPQEFQPDIVILDLEVPEKEGERPVDNSKVSTAIVREKFSEAPTFYYTSYLHGERMRGVGDTPDLARWHREPYSARGLLDEETAAKFREKYPELKDISDKSNPKNWLTVLQVLPVVTSQLKFTEKLLSFHF
jgi:hypothetical protein